MVRRHLHENKPHITHPKNLVLHFSHRKRTGEPFNGQTMLLVSTLRGTLGTFPTANKSSRTSLLPHFGQTPVKNLSFGGRFLFMPSLDVV